MSSGRRLYVGRVHPSAGRKDVEDMFASLGPVTDVRLNQGYGFVEYAELKDAEEAVATLNGADLMGDRITVEYARPPRERSEYPPRGGGYGGGGYGGGYGGGRGGYGGRDGGYGGGGYDRPPPRGPPRGSGFRVVVEGVPEGTSWQDLKDFGRNAGAPTHADVDRDGKGYLEYGSREEADDAIRKLGTTDLNGAPVTVTEAAPGSGPQREYRAPRQPRDSYGGGGGDYGRRDDYRSRDYDRRDDRRDDRRGGGDDYRRDDRRDYDRQDDRREPREDTRRRSPSPRRDRERDRSPVRD